MKRSCAWTLPELMKANRNAATVYLAVVWLASGRRQVGTTRARIRAACRLSERCIGAALEALHEASWIVRRYSRAGHKTWYRLTLIDGAAVDFGAVVRKTRHRELCKKSKNVPQGIERCGTKIVPHSRKGVGGDPAPSRGDPAPATIGEHPSVRIESERLAAIRAAREQSEAAAHNTIAPDQPA